jgi:wobble nucleotide-excising tRNase
MLKSIVKIKNCPSFVDFKPPTDLPDFGKFNLFYGWNGSGKTSFSRTLRSFETRQVFFDSQPNPAEFEFKLVDGTVIGNSDLSVFSQIRVFNKDFIDDTVFCDGGPKSIFYLGKQSKEDKEKILKAENQLEVLRQDARAKELLASKAGEAKSKSLSSKAKEIKVALTTPRDDHYRNYEKPNIENTIRVNSEDLKTPDYFKLSDERITAIKKSILQVSRQKIDVLSLPNMDITDLKKDVKNIIEKTVVSQVIESLKADDVISKWVETGLDIHKEKALGVCAFCNQAIPKDRLENLEKHFNDEYQKALQAVKATKDLCESRKVNLAFPESSSLYDDLASEYVLEKKKAEEAIREFNQVLDELTSALEQKERNLFTKPSLKTVEPVDAASLNNINVIIGKHNLKTDNFETQVDADKRDLELHFISEFMPEYNQLVVECELTQKNHADAAKVVTDSDEEIRKLKESLVSHHMPAQQINSDLAQFLGRSDIQLKATDEQDGYRIMRNDEVAKNLSEGERTALAIVYFLAKLKEDGFDIKTSVIVIDDPVCSLDSNSIFQAFSFIKESIKEAGQIIILTHHFDFFRQVKRWFVYHKKERACYMTVCQTCSGIRRSSIVPMDKLLLDFESEYHFLFNILYNFAEKKQQDLKDLYPMPNVARKFLESFLAFRVPLGTAVTNIHSRLEHIQFDPKKKERIRNFVDTHSHPRYESGVQDFDMSILTETPSIVSELMELVKTEDQKHYDFLVKSITSKD